MTRSDEKQDQLRWQCWAVGETNSLAKGSPLSSALKESLICIYVSKDIIAS